MAFTPADPTKAEVKVIQNGDQLGFDFYIPRGAKGDPGGINNGTAIPALTDWNTLTTSGMYYATGAEITAMPNSCPSMAIGVALMVIARSSVVVTQHAWTVSNAHSQFMMTRSLVSGTWGPWKVHRNTNIDQSGGRAITIWDELNNRSQLIFGDTGWRNITADLVNGWTATSVYVRRYNDRVTVKMFNVDGAAAAGNPAIFTLPLGFRTPHGSSYFPVYTSATTVSTILVSNGGTFSAPGGVTRYGAAAFTEVTYSTIDTWPGTLPGTAVGSIPNI